MLLLGVALVHPVRSLVLPCLLLGTISFRSSAQSPLTLAQYHHTAWTTRDGAPANVYALAESGDGFLWLGTSAGLYRFDGVRFELVDKVGGAQLPAGDISTLLVVREELWVGHRLGGISRLTKDSIQTFGSRHGLPDRSVWTLARDSSGTMWAGTTVGLYRLEGARWRAVGPEEGVPRAFIISVIADARGRIWVGTMEGVVRRDSAGGRFSLVHQVPRSPPDEPPNQPFLRLGEGPRESIWLSSWMEGVKQLEGGSAHAGGETHLPRQRAGIMYVDRTGDLWVGVADRADPAGEGLKLIPNDGSERNSIPADSLRLTRSRGLSGAGVLAILGDREGDVWVGTSGGLDRFRRPKMVRVVMPQLTPPFTIIPVDTGQIWVGSGERGIGVRGVMVGAKGNGLRTGPMSAQCAYRDPDGTVWVGTITGLWRMRKKGEFEPVPLPADLVRTQKQAITRDAGGALWLSIARKGVYKLTDGRWINFGGLSALPQEPALVLTTDTNGRTWFGYTGNRVALLERDSVRVFTNADGLDVGSVLSIHVRGAHVWIGGERGIALFDGRRFRMLHDRSGLTFGGTSGIVETPQGELWLHGARGIARVPATEVSRAAADPSYRVWSERLDFRDGLEGTAEQLRPIPTAVEGFDGKIWFATSTDLYWIDPLAIPRNALPPLVAIRDLVAGGRSYSGTAPLELPQRTTDVQIDFAAMGLSVPERIRFRYQLAGSDTGWQDVGGRRQAFYTNLGPGSYRFRVVAANEDGVWNESGAALAFTIPPSFTQSRWFLALWMCALAVAAWLLYRLRVRQLSGRLRARYQVALAERTRIAQDLHDTLLQGFTGLSLQVVAAASRVSEPPEAVGALRNVVVLAQQTLTDARQAIWDLRSADLDHQSLAEALEVAARSAVSGNGVEIRFATKGAERRMASQLETTALRVGREAIVNAVKHAAPRLVEVVLEYAPQLFVLRVADDGIGMPAEVANGAVADGHWGVSGMRQRANRAGGDLSIITNPGRGTVVSLRLPLESSTSS